MNKQLNKRINQSIKNNANHSRAHYFRAYVQHRIFYAEVKKEEFVRV